MQISPTLDAQNHPHHSISCRSSIEMIPKIGIFCKLAEPKVGVKRADFGVKTQPISRLKVSYFEEQSNLSCEAK
jgi:hypothetical protein